MKKTSLFITLAFCVAIGFLIATQKARVMNSEVFFMAYLRHALRPLATA